MYHKQSDPGLSFFTNNCIGAFLCNMPDESQRGSHQNINQRPHDEGKPVRRSKKGLMELMIPSATTLGGKSAEDGGQETKNDIGRYDFSSYFLPGRRSEERRVGKEGTSESSHE